MMATITILGLTSQMEDIPRSSSPLPPLNEPRRILNLRFPSSPEHHFEIQILKRWDMDRADEVENKNLLAGFLGLTVLQRWFRQIEVRTEVATSSILLGRIACFHLLARTYTHHYNVILKLCFPISTFNPFDLFCLSFTCSVVVASQIAVPFPVSLPPAIIIALPSFASL